MIHFTVYVYTTAMSSTVQIHVEGTSLEDIEQAAMEAERMAVEAQRRAAELRERAQRARRSSYTTKESEGD